MLFWNVGTYIPECTASKPNTVFYSRSNDAKWQNDYFHNVYSTKCHGIKPRWMRNLQHVAVMRTWDITTCRKDTDWEVLGSIWGWYIGKKGVGWTHCAEVMGHWRTPVHRPKVMNLTKLKDVFQNHFCKRTQKCMNLSVVFQFDVSPEYIDSLEPQL